MKNLGRVWGLAICLTGLCIGYIFSEQPDLKVTEEGKVIGVRQADGSLAIRGKQDYWQIPYWKRETGSKNVVPITTSYVHEKGYKIAFDAASCTGADLAIVKQKDGCDAAQILVPKKHQTYWVYLDKTIRIQNEKSLDKNRPWGEKHERGKK